MSEDALPCIVCGRLLENVFVECDNQPEDGLAFETYGHYGTTVFDPEDGQTLVINVCDECLERAGQQERVYLGRNWRPVLCEGQLVGREWVQRPPVPWREPGQAVRDMQVDVVHVRPEEVGTELPNVEWREGVQS